jgi:hypothetical protein
MHPIVSNAFGVVELRRYATRPERRDDLVRLFERELIETQEAFGMSPFGHYRNLDDPDSFVWLRGFARLEVRRDALEGFYTSQSWRDHRTEANATMLDSDNVLLLRNARPGSGFDLSGLQRPASSEAPAVSESVVAVSVFMLREAADDALIAAFEDTMLPQIHPHVQRLAYLVTEERANDFPALPVREGEHAFVVAAVCPTAQAVRAWSRTLHGELPAGTMRSCVTSREMLRLQPEPRTLYR